MITNERVLGLALQGLRNTIENNWSSVHRIEKAGKTETSSTYQHHKDIIKQSIEEYEYIENIIKNMEQKDIKNI